jgi:uncharacterized protein
MTKMPNASRRDVLKGMATVPLFTVAGGTAQSLLFAGSARAAMAKSAEFTGMDAPTTAAARATTSVESGLQVTFDDGTKQTFQLGYRPFFLTGDEVPDGNGGTTVAGGIYDVNGAPAMDPSAATPMQFFSDCPDGFSLLQRPDANVPGVKGNTVFGVVQFEYLSRDAQGNDMYGKLPSPIAVLTLDQDPQTGELSLVKYSPVDESPAHGLWITCAGSLSPWGTHLSSEEYEPDATIAATHEGLRSFSQYFFGDADKANPYHYGHLPEVVVNADGTGTLKKHFGTGRISKELVQVMPDQRTLIMGDDYTNAGIFMFITDKAADLSAGTLYVAKAAQQAGVAIDKGGAFDLTWMKLGHATSEEIKHLADTLTATDIVDVKTEDPSDGSYTAIGYNGKPQWVKFKPGMEQAAIFLETHRYAAAMGGTLAFTKMEGVTLNAKDKVSYIAMSYIYKTMSDGSAGIQVDKINAGAVYQQQLAEGQTDTDGGAIDSAWVPTHMSAVPGLIGVDRDAPDVIGNTADADHIANPDNLKFSEALRTLFVGEDSGNHVNNFLWAYNVDTGALARVLSCPVGAESTGLGAWDDLNGFAYVSSNFQHPGDWEKGLHDIVKADVAPLIDKNYNNRRSSAVGYISGLPQTG